MQLVLQLTNNILNTLDRSPLLLQISYKSKSGANTILYQDCKDSIITSKRLHLSNNIYELNHLQNQTLESCNIQGKDGCNRLGTSKCLEHMYLSLFGIQQGLKKCFESVTIEIKFIRRDREK